MTGNEGRRFKAAAGKGAHFTRSSARACGSRHRITPQASAAPAPCCGNAGSLGSRCTSAARFIAERTPSRARSGATMKPVATPFASAWMLPRSPATRAPARRRSAAGARAVARVAVAALVHLQRVIAVRRQADQVVGDLDAVRALDERHRAARLRTDRRLQLRIGPFFVRRGKGGTAGQQAQRGGGQQRAPRAAGAHAVMSLFHSILMPAGSRLTRRPRRAGKGTREKSP